jgi:hypothetical protein
MREATHKHGTTCHECSQARAWFEAIDEGFEPAVPFETFIKMDSGLIPVRLDSLVLADEIRIERGDSWEDGESATALYAIVGLKH